MTIATETGLEYRARPNSHVKQADVPRIAEELAQIATAHGGSIAPVSVVSAAREPTSAMHPYFEWDDPAAAQEYRLEQARGLVRSIEVKVIRTPAENPERTWVRQYHHVRLSEP